MPTVEEIEDAVAELSPEEFERFSAWFAQHRTSRRGASAPAASETTEAVQETATAAPPVAPVRSGAGPIYPHVTVSLKGLGKATGPIIRRVSYAMSDADVSDAEIERYKSEVRAEADPVAVTKRWVAVE